MKASRKYSPQCIADWFLCNIDREAGDSITQLKLQKLVYYSQAWSLAFFSKPLFDEDFQAWTHGPALESLFQKYKKAKWEALPAPSRRPILDKLTRELLKQVLDTYGQHDAKYLEMLTHREDPWREARGRLPLEAKSKTVIPKESMGKYYLALYERSQKNSTE